MQFYTPFREELGKKVDEVLADLFGTRGARNTRNENRGEETAVVNVEIVAWRRKSS